MRDKTENDHIYWGFETLPPGFRADRRIDLLPDGGRPKCRGVGGKQTGLVAESASGLALVERVDTVKGEVSGASGDRQFRLYARLTPNAREMLERSREFGRGIDNTVDHKGYPLNYRERTGAPSIQVSIARDGLQADIDVDYRASSFPIMLLNGHLSASNSDVRGGNNADRHAGRWAGFQNWWPIGRFV